MCEARRGKGAKEATQEVENQMAGEEEGRRSGRREERTGGEKKRRSTATIRAIPRRRESTESTVTNPTVLFLSSPILREASAQAKRRPTEKELIASKCRGGRKVGQSWACPLSSLHRRALILHRLSFFFMQNNTTNNQHSLTIDSSSGVPIAF